MKQTFAKIILAITGILMLVLSVLPHHHHSNSGSNLICFSLSITGEADHEHNPESNQGHNEADCDIRNIFVMSGRDDLYLHCHICNNDNHSINIHLLSDILLSEQFSLKIFEKENHCLYDIYGAEALHSEYILNVHSLRAPPVYIA